MINILSHLENIDVQLQKPIEDWVIVPNWAGIPMIIYLQNPGYEVNSCRKSVFLFSSWSCSLLNSCINIGKLNMLDISLSTFDRDILLFSELKNLVVTKGNNKKECIINKINRKPEWVWQRQLENISTNKGKEWITQVKYKQFHSAHTGKKCLCFSSVYKRC